jgi:GNAT superfamily N-acetyltransferase
MTSFAAPEALTLRSVAYDAPAVRELVAAMLFDLNERYAPGAFPPVDPVVYAPPWGDFVVAAAGTLAVGCAGFVRVDEGMAELRRMFVRSEWRRRGVASLLLRDVEERAWASGYAAMRLETGQRQPEALALFRRSGYREIPRFPPHCDDTSSVCMAKELRPFH